MSDLAETRRYRKLRAIDIRVVTEFMRWQTTCPTDHKCGHSVGTNRDGSSAKRNFVLNPEGKEVEIPYFSTDHNAVATMEAMADYRLGFGEMYVDALAHVLWNGSWVGTNTPSSFVTLGTRRITSCGAFKMLCATPEQRCRAILAVVDLLAAQEKTG